SGAPEPQITRKTQAALKCLNTRARVINGWLLFARSQMPTDSDAAVVGELVPDPEVYREFHISAMTAWRWDRDPELIALGWPPPVYIRRRKHRERPKLEEFKQRLVQQAIT